MKLTPDWLSGIRVAAIDESLRCGGLKSPPQRVRRWPTSTSPLTAGIPVFQGERGTSLRVDVPAADDRNHVAFRRLPGPVEGSRDCQRSGRFDGSSGVPLRKDHRRHYFGF